VTSNGSTSTGSVVEQFGIRWNANQEWGHAIAGGARDANVRVDGPAARPATGC
jgi:hypothetical protein